jgi:hypothetical protein
VQLGKGSAVLAAHSAQRTTTPNFLREVALLQPFVHCVPEQQNPSGSNWNKSRLESCDGDSVELHRAVFFFFLIEKGQVPYATRCDAGSIVTSISIYFTESFCQTVTGRALIADGN